MAIRWDELEGANFGPYLHSIENEAERLEVLYRECYDEIQRLCQRTLAEAGNFSDADDAAQETLMKLAASVCKSYKPEMPFRPWLRQVAINVCKDFGRVRKRTDRTTERCVERGYGIGLRTPTPEAEGPEESVIRNMWKDAVVQSLLALPESERRALYRQVYEGMSYEEIGVLEGHSHSSVRSHIFRAKERVKRYLAAVGGIDELGVPGVVGAAVAAMRRFRARSRAWMLRNSPVVGVDGGPLNVALLARATEVVAAGVVAIGALALPHGGAVASGPARAMNAAPVAAVRAAAPVVEGTHAGPHAASAAGNPVAPTAPPQQRATEIRVTTPDGSGPTQTATVDRTERSIVIGEGLTGPVPVFGEDYSRHGETEYGCGETSGQVVCGAYDHLPLGS